jgi:protein SCO1
MNSVFKNRFKRTFFMCSVGLVIGVVLGWIQIQSEKSSDRLSLQPVAGIQIDGAFSMIDHHGVVVTERDFKGYKLIYFGFVSCPAVCPTELQKIAAVLKELGKRGEQIQPLFITIDPERDTAPVLKEYVGLFHPRLVGLTGTRAQIDSVLKNYRIFARKVQDSGLGDYTMDHSSFVYLMSPEDRLIALYRTQDTAHTIARDVAARLGPG